ncbi:MAG: hypothetical protein ACFFAU_01010 [Candidatus Hodarchaeota archaeon]
MEDNKLVVYLGGPMEDLPDGGTQWRDRVTKELIEYFGDRIKILDPCKMEPEKLEGFIDKDTPLSKIKELLTTWRQSGHWDKFDPAVERIIDVDLDCIKRSDFVIMFLKFTDKEGNKVQMGGTISELTYAYRHRIITYSVTYNTVSKCNSWIVRMARGRTKPIEQRKIYHNFTQVIEDIKKDYKEFKATKKQIEKLKEERQHETKEIK